jgi:hypothetical protein
MARRAFADHWEEPSEGTGATRAATRHQPVALRAPSPEATTVARQSRSRSWGGSGREIVSALPLDDGRLRPW